MKWTPHLSCAISYEDIAKRVGLDIECARHAITRLNTLGYLKTLERFTDGIVFKIDYPLEGLLVLKTSSKTASEPNRFTLYELRGNHNPLAINLLNGYPVNRMHRNQLPVKEDLTGEGLIEACESENSNKEVKLLADNSGRLIKNKARWISMKYCYYDRYYIRIFMCIHKGKA